MANMKNGTYRIPDGRSKQKCIYWDDWVKYKYSKPELFWEENHYIPDVRKEKK